ncbi:MAG: ABC transporter permease [Anaerolineales bacterium]|jgi:ABC-2 type transport system permease protein
MRKIWLVLRHELFTTLGRRSFQLMAFILPLIGVLIFVVLSIVKGGSDSGVEIGLDSQLQTELEVEGYVDLAGLIHALPEDLPADILVRFETEALALQAIESGEIAAYYVIPDDYIDAGELIYVHPTLTPTSPGGQERIMRRTLLQNLLGGDEALADRIWDPMDLEATNLTPGQSFDRYATEDCTSPGPACQSSALVRYIPFIMIVLLFMFISQGGGLLMRSISGEKQYRVMEIMLLSVSPRQMLAGKLAGLGIASLLATITWIVGGYTVLRFGGGLLNLPSELSIPPMLLVWTIVFFILGYILYGSLNAGAGALVPNMKEITQATWVIMIPLISTYMVGLFLSGEAPHGPLSTFLSLFPLSAPILMIMRLTVGGVPAWQIVLSIGLMLATCFLIVQAVARMFRAQHLLSGQAFGARRFFGALLGRAG